MRSLLEMKDSDNFTAYNVPRQCQCQTVVERGKLVTTVHRLMQFFTVSVYGSIRPRAVGPGLTIFFNISYLVITQSWTRNATTMAGIFFSIVTLLLCFREKSHSEN